jgi:hypothetical protein
MMTGRHLLAHGVVTARDRLPNAVPTLAEALHRTERVTAGIVSMLYLGSSYGFGRGFDYYDDKTIPADKLVDSVRDEPAPIVTKLATKWLHEHQKDRFFFLHFWDVHYDYSTEGSLIYDFQPPQVEFYAPADRQQMTNVAREEDRDVKSLRLASLADWLNREWRTYRSLDSGRESLKLDEATTERLRALAY